MNSKNFIFIVFLLNTTAVSAQWFNFSGDAMTTRVDMVFWDEDAQHAEQLSQKVFDEFERIDQSMSRYKPESELSKVNRLAGDKAVPVSDELFWILNKSQKISQLSNGAFDMTFASLGYLYDFRKKEQPDKALIKTLLPKINYHHVSLTKTAGEKTVSFTEKNVMLDLGGIAKGYTVDKAIEILQVNGIKHARLSAGGDMRLLGDKKGKPWMVGIKDPRNEANFVVALPLANISISTSGDYERFFIDAEGKRIHHILSPKTGRPARGVESVSVIGPDTTTTDGLSTAIFVLGVEKGLTLVDKLPGIDAVIVDKNHRLFFSKDLASENAP